eukprot:6726014-Pyramimonas_sp.AAC.1
MSETNDVLVEFDKAGYKSTVCPAGAESARFTSKAGGVAVGVSKKSASWPLRHHASNMGDLPGKRVDKHKKDQNIATGVRFKDLVGMQVLLTGAHIAIFVGYLYNGWGIAGASVEKLRHMVSLVSPLPTPWVVLCDWNFPPEALRTSGRLNLVQGTILVADSVDCTCTGGQGAFINYVVVS